MTDTSMIHDACDDAFEDESMEFFGSWTMLCVNKPHDAVSLRMYLGCDDHEGDVE